MTQKSNAVNWFEIPVSDLSRAKEFYEHVLGIKLAVQQMGPLEMAWFPGEHEIPGATGALVKAAGYEPSHQGSLVYFSVPDITIALDRAQQKSGKVLLPKMSIGQWGFIAHFEDCEGNRVALHALS